jgi:hypothetical protein
MEIALRMTGKRVWKTSKDFDLDSLGTRGILDDLIENQILCKTLETDSLLFIEGDRRETSANFISEPELINERRDPENWDDISAADYEEEFAAKFDLIEERKQKETGWFEKQSYLKRIFPTLKIQKPGKDLYGWEALLMGVILLYTLFCFSNITFSQSIFAYMAA